MSVILQRVSEEELAHRIDSAQESITLYAPGVKELVAESLCRAIPRLLGQVKVVLDVSQKSVDMGFLSPAAVVSIWEAQLEIINGEYGFSGEGLFFHLPGLRIGILLVDDREALIYAPFAENMEDDCLPVVQACPSGVEAMLSEQCAEYDSLELTTVTTAMVEPFGTIALKPARKLSEIRTDYEERIKAIEEEKREAEERCAKAEEKAKMASEKAVEEYKSQFKIRKVELSISSQPASIGRKRITIPSMFLVGVGNEVEKNLAANYKLFPDTEELGQDIEREHKGETISDFVNKEKAIRDKYLIQVPKFGSYIRSCKETAFKAEVEELKKLGETVGAHIRKTLSDKVDKALCNLFDQLNAQWANTSDPWWKAYYHKHLADHRSIKDIFLSEMRKGPKGTIAIIENYSPEVTCFSTPIDESLAKDGDFLQALEGAIRKINSKSKDGKDKLRLEDLIALNQDLARIQATIGEAHDRERT